MRRIGLSIAGTGATIRVILPNEPGIFFPCFNVCQFVMVVSMPIGPLKDWNTALRADSSPGQDKNTATFHCECLPWALSFHRKGHKERKRKDNHRRERERAQRKKLG